MEVFDAKQIGKLIAWGGEHMVHEYGSDQVIKFSLLDYFVSHTIAREKALFDIETCREVFGEYMVSTTVVSSPDGTKLAKLQPKILGRPLVPRDMGDSYIAQQFSEILRCHDVLVNTKKEEIDFMGGYGSLSGRLTNIFLTTDNEVRIIDTLLISIPGLSLFQPIIAFVRNLVRFRQNAITQQYRNMSALR